MTPPASCACRQVGLAGAMIPLRPMEHRYDHPTYEPLWAAAQDLDMPLSLHVGTYRWRPGTDPNDPSQDIVEFTNRECDARNAIAAMIYAGVFERYPRLKVGAVEFEVAGLPTSSPGWTTSTPSARWAGNVQRFKDGLVPSDFFRRNVFISFQEDDLGIQLRSHIGVDNLMWGSDYPHAESTFPKSRQIVERILKDVPDRGKDEDRRRRMRPDCITSIRHGTPLPNKSPMTGSRGLDGVLVQRPS